MSKSQIEELISCLWLILTILLWQNKIAGWWIVTLCHGIIGLIAATVFSYKNRLEKKRNEKVEK